MATYTPEELAKVVANLERQGARQSDEVRAAVAPAPTRPAKAARTAPSAATRTQEPEPATEGSPLEAAFLAALMEHGADLPPCIREYHFFAPWRGWRFDFAFPVARDCLIAVEIDGGQFMTGGGRHNTDADREKLNTAAALGWRVLRFSGTQIRSDPAACIALVRRALER